MRPAQVGPAHRDLRRTAREETDRERGEREEEAPLVAGP